MQAMANCNIPAGADVLTAEQQQYIEEQRQECKATGFMPKITRFDVKSEQIQGDRAQVEIYMCLQDPGDPDQTCDDYVYRLEKVNGEWLIYAPDCAF